MNQSEVTFKDFAQVATRRGHTVGSLVETFRGKIDDPREFFERVMTCKYKREDRGGTVIPFRSVIKFYRREIEFFKDSNRKQRLCACGCGSPVFGRKKYRSAACRKRQERGKVTDSSKQPRKDQ